MGEGENNPLPRERRLRFTAIAGGALLLVGGVSWMALGHSESASENLFLALLPAVLTASAGGLWGSLRAARLEADENPAKGSRRASAPLAWLVFLCGIWLSCSAAGFVEGYVSAEIQSRSRAPWGLRPVLVASGDMPAGTVLSYDRLTQSPFPGWSVGTSAINPHDYEVVLDYRSLVAVRNGEPLHATLVGNGAIPGMCSWLPSAPSPSSASAP
jgi:hypothetical protein